jgi:hypothetical protein
VRVFGAALVCIVVLYALDAYFFDSRYKDGIEHALSDIVQHW